jgi:hypothetical protein
MMLFSYNESQQESRYEQRVHQFKVFIFKTIQTPFIILDHRSFYSVTKESQKASHLVEWVGAGSPVGQEQAEADGLQDSADNSDGHNIKRTLLGDDLRDELSSVSSDFGLLPLKRQKLTVGALPANKMIPPR